MKSLIRNIAAIILSVLIIAGNGGISIFAHSCSQDHHTSFYLENEDVVCDHADNDANLSGVFCQHENHCCDTKTIVLRLDEHTTSYNSDKFISFNSGYFVTFMERPVFSIEDTEVVYEDNDSFREIIFPQLIKKKLLRSASHKISSEPS